MSFNQQPRDLSSGMGGEHPLPEVMVPHMNETLSLLCNASGHSLKPADQRRGGGAFWSTEIRLTRQAPPARAITLSRPAQNFPA